MPEEFRGRYNPISLGNWPLHTVNTGNGIVMLIAAVLFCVITNIKHIDAKCIRGLYQTFKTKHGITIWANETCPFEEYEIWNQTNIYPWAIPICPDWNMTKVAETFRDSFVKTIPKKEIGDDTVVLSVRGGNAMDSETLTNYWQPPCSFYRDIQKKFNKSILIGTDLLNPCAQPLIENGAVFTPGDFMSDFSTTVWAKHLALSRSSFPRAALYMSAVQKDFYVFEGDADSINYPHNNFMTRFLEHGDHWECLASEEYKRLIVPGGFGNWSCSEEQRNLLERDSCEWHRVTIANRSWITVGPSTYDIGWDNWVYF
jgi:hypothetical protein